MFVAASGLSRLVLSAGHGLHLRNGRRLGRADPGGTAGDSLPEALGS